MSNPLYKQIKLTWKYPVQPTPLQVGSVQIVRGTTPFTFEEASSQTQIDFRDYSPDFTSYTDNKDLEEEVTYFYMIIVYGDIDNTILAATELYKIKVDSDPDIIYVKKSTGERVKVVTGPIVSRETIDPDVDFTNTESESYLAWKEAVADRSELYILQSVTTVKEGAFAYWSGLEKVHTDATELEENSFAGDRSITEFVFLPSTRRILGTLVSGCTFTKLQFNEGLQKIHSECFPGCNFPGGVLVIPDSVTSYVKWEWNDDYTEKFEVPATGLTAIFGIEKLIIGGGVPKIDTQQWSSMLSSVKHLEFRPGVTHITGPWSAASYTCETLILPQGLLEIGSVSSGYTFGDFNKLKELLIPGTVQYISKTCFQSMEMLEKLTIERGVGFIDEFAFQNFGSEWSNKPHPLKEFNFLGGTVIGEMAFQNWYLADPNFEIVIPDTVTEIKKNAFQNHDNTKSLRFAEGCQANVGYYAFGNWFKAESLYIADSVQSINGSFGQWYRGREIYIGKGIKTLGGMVDIWGDGNLRVESEFSNWGSDYSNPDLSHLASKTIIIPDNVETILDVFAGGSRLETLIVSAGLKTLGNINLPYCKSIFIRCPNAPEILEYSRLLAGIPGQAVYVPSLVGYGSVVNNTFTTYTPPLNSSDPHGPTPIVVQDGDWDVQYLDLRTGSTHTLNCTIRGVIDDDLSDVLDLGLIDDIVFGAGVTHIGARSFLRSSVKRIQFLGNNLKSIGPAAFAACFVFGGDSLVLPESLQRIGTSAFANIERLNTITYGSNFISVSEDSFGINDKFETPSQVLPPSPTFVSNTDTTITGLALFGDTILGVIKRDEEIIDLPPTVVNEEGMFTIDLSLLKDSFTLREGDSISLLVKDFVSNMSTPTSVTIGKVEEEEDLIITCEGATEMALLLVNSTETSDATAEVWVNDEHLATVPVSQLADSWASVPNLLQNSQELGYGVQAAEAFIGIGLLPTAGKEGIRFKIVLSENGKNYLSSLSTIPGTEQIVNPTAYQDPDSGVIVFCLKKQPDKILRVSFSVVNEGSVINLPFGVHTVATGSDVSYSVTSPSNITTVYDDPGTAQDSLSYMRELPFEEGFWSVESSSLSSEIFTPIISYVYIGTARNAQMPTEAVGSLVNNELVITVNMENDAVATLIPNDNNDDPIAYAIPNSNGVATFKIPMTTFDGYIRATNISHGSQGISFTYP